MYIYIYIITGLKTYGHRVEIIYTVDIYIWDDVVDIHRLKDVYLDLYRYGFGHRDRYRYNNR